MTQSPKPLHLAADLLLLLAGVSLGVIIAAAPTLLISLVENDRHHAVISLGALLISALVLASVAALSKKASDAAEPQGQ